LEKRTSDRIQVKAVNRTEMVAGAIVSHHFLTRGRYTKSDFSSRVLAGQVPNSAVAAHLLKTALIEYQTKILEESVSADLNGDTPAAIGLRVVPHYGTDNRRTAASAIAS
jgi:hypothetical protein